MKQKDIAIIVIVVIVSGLASFFLSNKLFAIPNDQRAEVEVIDPITADFPQPDERYFNSKSVDPTQSIKIGDNENPKPFNEAAN
jgi:hypothetical protein